MNLVYICHEQEKEREREREKNPLSSEHVWSVCWKQREQDRCIADCCRNKCSHQKSIDFFMLFLLAGRGFYKWPLIRLRHTEEKDKRMVCFSWRKRSDACGLQKTTSWERQVNKNFSFFRQVTPLTLPQTLFFCSLFTSQHVVFSIGFLAFNTYKLIWKDVI